MEESRLRKPFPQEHSQRQSESVLAVNRADVLTDPNHDYGQ